jgi:H/ACA ribonucleoprotein complex subunit 1
MSMSRGGRGRGRPGGGGGRGGGRGGGGRREEGPPAEVIEVGKIMHECESEMVCKLSHTTGMIPYFNASIYLENKKKIGKVDEIFGPIQKVMFTVSYFQIRIIIFRCWIVTRI